MTFLPRRPHRVIVPPIKTQGIKTKLVRFIMSNVRWDGEGRWVEPFLGSGVVLFNVQPRKALVADINPHIINFYQGIYRGEISAPKVRAYLEEEGEKLLAYGEDYYYEVRSRFNETHHPLDFLFLNRASFNGVIRFNSRGEFNVPFCRKPGRFRKAYVTKIVNQVLWVRQIMRGREWEFRVATWQETLSLVCEDDFVYLDPPYVGRHTDYYSRWTEQDAVELARRVRALPCGFALSLWKENRYRKNHHLALWADFTVERVFEHFYHVGATEELRHPMVEALLIKRGFEATLPMEVDSPAVQLSLAGHTRPVSVFSMDGGESRASPAAE